MIINRIIYIAALVAAFVFSSFYEGYVPVIIRYVVILILPVSLMYLCIIYLRINIRQSVKEGIYLKNEAAEYRLEIDNKSILPYLNISIFLSDNTSVHHVDVLPFEKYVLKTGIKCCYAGECHVGVEKIILYDFLRLFRLVYNCTDMVKRHIINNDREFDNYYGQCQNISFFERDAVKMVLKDINGIYGNMRRQTIVISADRLNEEFWGE